MRALFDLDLPNVYQGWFLPIERIVYDEQKPYHEYIPRDYEPIHLRKKGYSGTRHQNSILSSVMRDTGGVLVLRSNSKTRIYARASDGAMILPLAHPLAGRFQSELQRAYVYHYERSRFVPNAFVEAAISCFGEPKDRRYNQYILATPEAFAEYEKMFHRYPQR